MTREEPTLNEWRKTIEVANRLKEMAPWKQFEDTEIFALKIPGEDIIYCSLLGYHEICIGVSFYRGKEGLEDVKSSAYVASTESYEMYCAMQQSFLALYFDDQDNVSYEQEHVFKKLGIKKQDYPHFMTKEKNCFPGDPDRKELEKYALYLRVLIDALEYYFEHGLSIDFEANMFLYDDKRKDGKAIAIEFAPRQYPSYYPPEETLKEYLKIESNQEKWEVDYNFINQGIENDEGLTVNVRFFMMADEEGRILACTPLLDDADEDLEGSKAFLEAVESYGRPSYITIGNPRLYPLLGPTCDYLQIEMLQSDELPSLQAFLEEYLEFASSLTPPLS